MHYKKFFWCMTDWVSNLMPDNAGSFMHCGAYNKNADNMQHYILRFHVILHIKLDCMMMSFLVIVTNLLKDFNWCTLKNY